MDTHFFRGGLRAQIRNELSQSSYEAFKNAGFEVVQNDTLRKSIIYLFEEAYEFTDKWATYNNEYAIHDINIWYKYFLREDSNLKPLNYQTVLESSEVLSYYHSVYGLRRIFVNNLRVSLNESERVLQMIKEELTRIGG